MFDPVYKNELDENQRRLAITLYFKNVDNFNIAFKVSPEAPTHRKFLVAGFSSSMVHNLCNKIYDYQPFVLIALILQSEECLERQIMPFGGHININKSAFGV